MLTTVFGKRGSGKTTLIRALIESPETKKPIVIVDLLGNYNPKVNNDNNEAENPNDPSWVLINEPALLIEELKKYVSDPKSHSGIIVAQSPDADRMLDYACAALWEIKGGTLVVDEADFVSLAECPCFDEAIRYGRNRGIDLITGCRRPAEISKNVTAGADLILCFTTHEPRDIEYFSKVLGKDFAERLPTLEKHHGIFIDYRDELQGVYKTDRFGRVFVVSEEKIT